MDTQEARDMPTQARRQALKRAAIKVALTPWTEAMLDECVKRARQTSTEPADVAMLTDAVAKMVTALDNMTRI